MKALTLSLLLFLGGCGYRVEGLAPISVSVPYVVGDHEGKLTDALAWALSKAAGYQYVRSGGKWTLCVSVVDENNDRIGYRYDRQGEQLKDNVIGIENRKDITVEVCLTDAATGELILGPQKLKAAVSYDYDDPTSPVDLSFIDPTAGSAVTSIDFSLGQLDSVAAAGEDAIEPIYRLLAQKIVDGMIASGDWGEGA